MSKSKFEQDRYLFVKEFIDPNLATLFTSYSLHESKHRHNLERSEGVVNPSFKNTHHGYADALMESLLEDSLPKMEKLTGIGLWPTYSFYRVYRQYDELTPHRDREACEISVTLCLGYDHSNLKDDYNWKFFVDGKGFDMKPGDAVIYRGCELLHWREELQGLMQAQVFMHYCDKNGPHKNEKFDTRPGLGYGLEYRKK